MRYVLMASSRSRASNTVGPFMPSIHMQKSLSPPIPVYGIFCKGWEENHQWYTQIIYKFIVNTYVILKQYALQPAMEH